MEAFILSQKDFKWEDLMEYGPLIILFVGGFLLQGAKAIIDAINKKNEAGGGPGPATPMQGKAPAARPLPPRIRGAGQAPVARPLPGRPAASGQMPAPPKRTHDEIVIPQLVREPAKPQGNVPSRPPEGRVRRLAPAAPTRPPRTKSSKPQKRVSREKGLGHLEAFSHDKHLDPESHLKLEKQRGSRAGDGSELGDLSSRAALRKAIVMNEILGQPLALRQEGADPWGP